MISTPSAVLSKVAPALATEAGLAISATPDMDAVAFSQLLQTLRPPAKQADTLLDSVSEPPTPSLLHDVVPLQINLPLQPLDAGARQQLLSTQLEKASVVSVTSELFAQIKGAESVSAIVAPSPQADLLSVIAYEVMPAVLDRSVVVSETVSESRLSVPVRHPEWAVALGQRVQALLQQNNQIQIRLDPPELGKLDVQIQVDDAGTQILFHTEQREVREALERAFPRLHEMLTAERGGGLEFQFGSQRHFHPHEQSDQGRLESEVEVKVDSVADNEQSPKGLLTAKGVDFYA